MTCDSKRCLVAGEAPCQWKNGPRLCRDFQSREIRRAWNAKGWDGTCNKGWFQHAESMRVSDFLVAHKTESKHFITEGIQQQIDYSSIVVMNVIKFN